MANVLIGIGVSGAGKTTALKAFHSENAPSAVYVSPDEIRRQISGDEADQGVNAIVWSRVFELVRDSLCAGRHVIIDATNARYENRVEMIEWCRNCGAEVIAGAWFWVPLDVCLARNSSRERQVPAYAVERMYNMLEVDTPTLKDGFDVLEVIAL